MRPFLKFIPLLGVSLSLLSCTPTRKSPYQNGMTYDVSFKQDGSVTATLNKIDGGFNLTISGSGRTKTYADESEVPWHYISKRIIDVKIEDGITIIGNYLFHSLTSVQGFMLPATITAIGRGAFRETAELYSYSGSDISNGCDATIYFYQESMPDVSDVYWHYKNGVPTVWSTIKIFFIGNSFTYYYDIPALVEGLGKSLNEMIDVDYVVKGAATLATHASHTSETGIQIYNKLLDTDDYDYVILQEQSTTPYSNYNNFKNAVSSLAGDVKTTQKNCKVHLYSTWAYQDAADSQSKTIPDLEKLLRDSYIKCANELKTQVDDVNFVGPAFTKAYQDYPDIPIYYSDNKHQSINGAYLSACVHILSLIDNINIDETDFFGTKVSQYVQTNDPTAEFANRMGDGVPEETARTLISIAKETVAKYSTEVDDSETA